MFDVLVVGFGPVGATLTSLGAHHGLSVAAVDQEIDLYPLPRAAHCDHEVLRILQEIGCADEIVAAAQPNDGMDFLDGRREMLLRMRAPAIASTGWPSSLLFHQPAFEGAIRRATLATPATVRLGVGVCALEPHDDRVRATLDDGSTIDARYVVGCDGARSFVRRAAGVSMHDYGFEEPWLVVDVVVHGDRRVLPAHALQVCDPVRPHTLVPMPRPRFRFEFMLLPGEDPAAATEPNNVRELVSAWIDPALVDVERAAVYTFHGVVARQWRRERIFLAGDAAHQMPPFLGQGMCSGMRDAANLVWKLAAVVHRDAPEALLDTYQDERDPHVRTIIETAVGFGRIICTIDPEVAASRDADMRVRVGGADQPPVPALGASIALTVGGGALSAQPRLRGRRFDDAVGPRFAVVTRTPIDVDHADARWWAERAALFDVEREPELADLLGTDAALVVRPDRYVFGRGVLAELTASARPIFGGAPTMSPCSPTTSSSSPSTTT